MLARYPQERAIMDHKDTLGLNQDKVAWPKDTPTTPKQDDTNAHLCGYEHPSYPVTSATITDDNLNSMFSVGCDNDIR